MEALETLLIHKNVIKSHGKPILKELENLGCKIVVDRNINTFLKSKYKLAKEQDWRTEYP